MAPRQKGIDIDFERQDGTKLHLGFLQSILRDPTGDEMGLILIFQDLTEFRQMQEQVRRMDRLAVAGELARITSYNVCYTKLLRSLDPGNILAHLSDTRSIFKMTGMQLELQVEHLLVQFCDLFIQFFNRLAA